MFDETKKDVMKVGFFFSYLMIKEFIFIELSSSGRLNTISHLRLGTVFQRAGLTVHTNRHDIVYQRTLSTTNETPNPIKHDSNIRQATVKWGTLEMIRKSSSCFREVKKISQSFSKDSAALKIISIYVKS